MAHDYPMSDNEVVSAVNELISKLDTVASIYDNLAGSVIDGVGGIFVCGMKLFRKFALIN